METSDITETTPAVAHRRARAEFPNVCAHELFERQVARHPSATALVFDGRALTYQELNARANQVAHHLRGMGVGPDMLVGVSLHRTPLMVIGLLGVWKAGAAYVPLDPAYPQDRLAFMIEDAAVHAVLTDDRAKALFPGVGAKLVSLDADWSVIERASRDNPAAGARPSNLAYVIYTSGSTGKPKGALIEHRGLVNYLWWAISAYGVEAGGSAPVHSSISFDLTVTSLYPALLAGGHVELLPEDVGAQSLLASLRRGPRRSLVKITPAHLELLTQQVSSAEAREMTRAFVIGGENLTAESLRFWREAAPETRLINEYGPTETVVGCCIHEVRPDDPHEGSVPIGRPIANTELYVLDPALQRVPDGTMGELYIGGVGVARGYLNRPELTRERFLPDPFSGHPGARLYKTGDLARRRSDGLYEYLGRVDDQVKIRGYRIELGEIEATLAGHPSVQSCAVVVREDAAGNKQLVGYVVPRKGQPPALEPLRQFLKQRLPDYMVPAQVVLLESLPLTQNGKVDRKALPAPSYKDAAPTQELVAPRTETERALAALWTSLLTLERIGVHDDVFDLGATSLVVIGAVSRIRSELGISVEMQVLFENPTVAEMAAALDQKAGKTRAAEPPAPSRTVAPAPVAVTPGAPEPQLIPIRFGGRGRELLGLYQRPSGDQDRRECCLLCNPFGQEAVRSHRAYRVLADRLARSGFHVLRFDYSGTGDSGGEDEDGTLERWTGDILLANDELMRRSGCSRGAWLGLRLGATLAALASARAAAVPRRLALWDPVVDGAAYLAELARAHVEARKALYELRWETERRLRELVLAETESEALGYPLTPALKAELGAISPATFRVVQAGRITLLGARPDAEWTDLRQQLPRSKTEVRTSALESNISWAVNEMLHDSIVLPQDVRSLTLALSEEG
jgi:amino acid adenylation domain-containing protein